MKTYREYMDMTTDEALRQSALDDAEWLRRNRMGEENAETHGELGHTFLSTRPYTIAKNLSQLGPLVVGAVVIWWFAVGL